LNGSGKTREEFFKTVSLPRMISQCPKLAGYGKLRGMHFALEHLLSNRCSARLPDQFRRRAAPAHAVDIYQRLWNADRRCRSDNCQHLTFERGSARRETVPLDRERVLEALRQCYDPEIPVNIVDLGLIYDVQHDDAGNVVVKMTLTTQGCPSALAIPEQVKLRIGTIEEVRDVKVELVWEPPWNPSMISPAGRQALGLEV
jgi:metal-sulfur cluster biosynthetic enzyme